MGEERGDQPFPEYGVLMLIPIEINSNCDFQGGGGGPLPPLDPLMNIIYVC